MKFRTDSDLSALTESQLAQLYDWISDHSYRETIRLAALPIPEGFGVQFNKTTLVRFYRNERVRRHALDLSEVSEANASDKPCVDPNELLAHAKAQLAHSCYDLAQHPDSVGALNAVSRVIHRFDTLKLESDKLTLDRQRLEEDKRQFDFSVIAAAAQHAAKLNEIGQRTDLTDHQKYLTARDVLFGFESVGSAPVPGAAFGVPPNGPLPPVEDEVTRL